LVLTYRLPKFGRRFEPGRWLITSVTFQLPRTPEWNIDYPGIREQLAGKELSSRTVSEAVIALRTSKLPDPVNLSNAGSFFKNPQVTEDQWATLQLSHPQIPGWAQPDGLIKTSAAWLIDQCGWKGKRKGDAGIYDFVRH
jgi:UDP-N-acetylmuramate dehydrogenase